MPDIHICFCLLVHTAVRLAVKSSVQYHSPIAYNFCIFYFVTSFNCIYIVWCFCDISQVFLRNMLIEFTHKHELEVHSLIQNIPALVMISNYIYCLDALKLVSNYTVMKICFMMLLQWKIAIMRLLALPCASFLLSTYIKLKTARWILIRFGIREFY